LLIAMGLQGVRSQISLVFEICWSLYGVLESLDTEIQRLMTHRPRSIIETPHS